jgi:GTPase SAR1 family protein
MRNQKKGLELFPTRRKIDNAMVRIELWEYSSKEKYREELADHLKRIHGCIIMYDITDRDSYASLPEWLMFVQDHGVEKTHCMIVGNKTDLEGKRKISTDEGSLFASTNRAMFSEISVKKKIGMEEALIKFLDNLLTLKETRDRTLQSIGSGFVRQLDSFKETTAGTATETYDDESMALTKETREDEGREYVKSARVEVILEEPERKPCCNTGCQIF